MNLAQALASEGLSFWMIQQDTIWRENFFLYETKLSSQPFDIMFDLNRNDEWDAEKKYICGMVIHFVFLFPVNFSRFRGQLASNSN